MSSARSARVSERKRKKNAPLRTRAKSLITKSNRLIDENDIIAEIEEIKNYAQQSVKMH